VTCLKYEGQPPEQRQALSRVSEVFTLLVILEVCCTMLGLGWEEFWHGTNRAWAPFDFTVLVVSSIDFAVTLALPDDGSHNLVAFRVLRALRALRFLRTAKRWEALSRALEALGIGGKNLLNLFVLQCLFIFIFAIVGMQVFAGRCDADARLHYDRVDVAMLSSLAVFTGEWRDVHAACAGGGETLLANTYFVLALFIGYFVLVNLFTAVLFQAFATALKGAEEGGQGANEEDGAGITAETTENCQRDQESTTAAAAAANERRGGCRRFDDRRQC
jgi:hypothetical protein